MWPRKNQSHTDFAGFPSWVRVGGETVLTVLGDDGAPIGVVCATDGSVVTLTLADPAFRAALVAAGWEVTH